MSKLPYISVRKINDCLNNAKEAYRELCEASGHDNIQSKWANFLRQSGSVIHSLEGACQLSPQLRQWYGGEVRKAKEDDFLKYMMQARNSEQHNSLPTLGISSTKGRFVAPGQTFVGRTSSFGIMISGDKVYLSPEMLESEDGQRPFLDDSTSKPLLMDAFDEKHKNRFPVPQTYKGKQLDPTSPADFAKEYLEYLIDLVGRAPKPASRSPS